MKCRSMLYMILISLHLIIIITFGDKKIKHKTKDIINKLRTCPCNADRLCSKSKNGMAICNCWTECNYECPAGFDRIDETTEYCKYGDTRNLCSTSIICDKFKSKIEKEIKDNNNNNKHSSSSSSSSSTKNGTKSGSGRNHLIGETEADTEDTGYFKLSIVGFVLWQIASIGLGMLV